MAKKTLLILTGRGANAVFALILTLAVSRALGPEGFGVFSFIVTVVFTALHLANFGLDTWLFREVSWDPDRGPSHLAKALSLKTITSLVTIGLIAAAFRLFPVSPETYAGLMLYSGALVFMTLSQGLWHYADGHSRVEYHTWLWAGSNGLKALAGGMLVFGYPHLNLLLITLLLVDGATFALSFVLIRRRFPLSPWHWNYKTAAGLFLKVLPLALVTFLAAFYFRAPIVFLKLMTTDREVGWFSAAFRLVELYTLIPYSIFLVLFPVLARTAKSDMARVETQSWRTGWMLTGLGLFAGIITYFLAPLLMDLLFGEAYLNGVPLLRGFSALLLFISWNYLLSHLLLSWGKERTNLWILAGVAPVCVLLNLVLIPIYGPMGAVGALLGAEGLYTLLLAIAVRSFFLQARAVRKSAPAA